MLNAKNEPNISNEWQKMQQEKAESNLPRHYTGHMKRGRSVLVYECVFTMHTLIGNLTLSCDCTHLDLIECPT